MAFLLKRDDGNGGFDILGKHADMDAAIDALVKLTIGGKCPAIIEQIAEDAAETIVHKAVDVVAKKVRGGK